MLLEQLGEGGHGDVEAVVAVVVLQALDLVVGGQALCVLERLDLRLGLLVERVRERGEGVGFGIVEKAALLEEERDGGLAADVLAVELADLGGAGVGDGVDLDELGVAHVAGVCGGEGALEVDIPVGGQPDERLDGADGADPDEGPLGGLDVLLVAGGRQVDGEEGRPDNEEGPDVGMQLQRQGVVQARLLDLRVVDERHLGQR